MNLGRFYEQRNAGELNYLCCAVYFFILLSIGCFIRDIPGQPMLLATVQNFMLPAEVTKLGDPTFFATGAIDIYQYGWIRPENQWLVKLWPPGFMIIEGLILKIFGINSPFILILIVINSGLLALMLAFFESKFRLLTAPLLAMLLPLIPLLFPVVRMFLLQPGGVILGEGLAIILFLLSMNFIQLSEDRRSEKYALFAGILVAGSAYIRTQFEAIVLLLTLVAFGLNFILFFILKRPIHAERRGLYLLTLRSVLIALTAAHAAMLPWRIHNFQENSTRSFSWVQKLNNSNRTDQELINAGGGWIVEGKGNIACTLERNYCGNSDSAELYGVFFRHSSEWFMNKSEVFPKYWFSSLRNYTNVSYPNNNYDTAINALILCLTIVNPLMLLVLQRKPHSLGASWHLTAMYAFYIAFFLFVHFETRYFYALKIYTIFLTVQIFASIATSGKLRPSSA